MFANLLSLCMGSSKLLELGIPNSQSDTSLFIKHDVMHVVILLLYVDDIIMTGFDDT